MGAQPGPFEIEMSRNKAFNGKDKVPSLRQLKKQEEPAPRHSLPLREEAGPFWEERHSLQYSQTSPSHFPSRAFDCPNYNTCLSLAAALDWKSFTCQGCSRMVNSQLLWRAHQRVRTDPGLAKLCNLPILT